MSYSSNLCTLLLLCTSAPLVLCCILFDRGSRQVKREPVDLATYDYDVSLYQRISRSLRAPILLCRPTVFEEDSILNVIAYVTRDIASQLGAQGAIVRSIRLSH